MRTQRRSTGATRGDGAPASVAGFDAEQVATGLGWFSIGVGLAGLVAPHGMAKLIGVPDDDRNCRVLQGLGVREIASGVGILTRPRQAGWVWSRVAGDAMDLTYLGTAFTAEESRKDRVAATAAAVVGVTVLDILTAERLSKGQSDRASGGRLTHVTRALTHGRTIHVAKTISIAKPADEIYRFWRGFENLPRFMWHIEEVKVIGDRRSHWKAKAPLGRVVEWDSEITQDKPRDRISWRSVEGSEVKNAGTVTFKKAPGDRGTTVRVELQYEPPGGVVGATVAKLFGREPGQEIEQDLRRLKALLEAGEIIQSDATVKGWGSGQPPKEHQLRR